MDRITSGRHTIFEEHNIQRNPQNSNIPRRAQQHTYTKQKRREDSCTYHSYKHETTHTFNLKTCKQFKIYPANNIAMQKPINQT